MSPRRPPPPHINVHLPSLDGEQALIFVNILERLIAATWRVHGHSMGAVLEEVYAPRVSSDEDGSPSKSEPSNPPYDPGDFPF